jgi:hypothetical protein
MRDRVHTHKQPMIECTAYEKNARLEKAIAGDGCERRSHCAVSENDGFANPQHDCGSARRLTWRSWRRSAACTD